MEFHTLPFLVFLPVVAAAFHLCPAAWSRLVLLGAGATFCGWSHPGQLVALVVLIAGTHWTAARLAATHDPGARRRVLGAAVVAALAVLCVLKYGVRGAALPVGLSYAVLRVIGHLADVHAGRRVPDASPLPCALYLTYFPAAAAGPIARAGDLLPQLAARPRADPGRIGEGLLRILWGLFKKIVVADRLALYVAPVFADPTRFTGSHALLATYLFAVQIYADFSGYTDIAIGAARVLGHDIPENFRQPYLATSLPEFWKRWHITLTGWLQDHVFLPVSIALLRTRLGAPVALTTTMLLCGAWHGLAPTFLLWGLYHAALLLIAHAAGPPRRARSLAPSRLATAARALVTFHLVCAGWILFRAPGPGAAFALATGAITRPLSAASLTQAAYPLTVRQLAITLLAAAVFLVLDSTGPGEARCALTARLAGASIPVRALAVAALIYATILLGTGGEVPFIYALF